MSIQKLLGIIILVGAGAILAYHINAYQENAHLLNSRLFKAMGDEYKKQMLIELVFVLLGFILIVTDKKSDKSNSNNIENKNAERSSGIRNKVTNGDEFKGNRDLDNDAYKIFLTKTYCIEKNDALGKFICGDKLFDNLDAVLNFAHNDYDGEKSSKEAEIYERKGMPATCPNCKQNIYTKTQACFHCNTWLGAGSDQKPIPK